MRFKKFASLVVPRVLWEELAGALCLDGPLPGALADDLGVYACKTLRVTIHRERRVPRGQVVTTGTYTYGHITLSPCIHCTTAFLTQVYLHELVHAWLHQHRPELYDRRDSCSLAERFSNAAFRLLGGRTRKVDVCASYSLPSRTTLARLHDLRNLARTLTEATPVAVQAWRPRPVGKKNERLEG